MKRPNPSFLRFLPILVFAMALPSASSAQSEGAATDQPALPWEGDIWTRERLTGDWGGARTALSENYGIDIQADVQQFYQGITSGGLDDNGDWEYNGLADYRLRFDSGQADLWPGGVLEIHGESYWGDSVNDFTGALLAVNFDQSVTGSDNGTYLSHVIITQFLSERFALTGGKIDTSLGDANDYAHGVGDQKFMNSAFSLNPVTYLSSPYSTLGGGFVYLLGPEKQSQFSIMVYDGDGTIDDAGFDTLFEGRTTTSTTLRLRTNFFDKKGHQWFGFLYGHGGYDPQTSDPRILLPPPQAPPGGFEEEDSTWAFFYNFDQQLVSDPHNPERDWGLFGRFGMADEDTSVISTFSSIGLGGTGLFPSRPGDHFGVGYYYMTFTDDRVKQVLPSDDEQGVEIFYTMAVTPSFGLSADLQVIDGAINGSDTAVISGFRGRISF